MYNALSVSVTLLLAVVDCIPISTNNGSVVPTNSQSIRNCVKQHRFYANIAEIAFGIIFFCFFLYFSQKLCLKWFSITFPKWFSLLWFCWTKNVFFLNKKRKKNRIRIVRTMFAINVNSKHPKCVDTLRIWILYFGLQTTFRSRLDHLNTLVHPMTTCRMKWKKPKN